MHYSSIDIFCHVVDNFGDIGVVYRFAREFHTANPHCRTRIFIDDIAALHAISPAIDESLSVQTHDGIDYIAFAALTESFVEHIEVADVLVEAFACHIPNTIMKAAQSRPRLIINLEHLSAEAWVEGYHLRPSLLGIENLQKYFFMPGFTEATGGVIVDHRIERIRERLTANRAVCLSGILRQVGHCVDRLETSLVGTVFSYCRGFDTMVRDLNALDGQVVLLVFGDKSRNGMVRTLDRVGGCLSGENRHDCGNVRILFMPFVPQPRYDALLCLADFNIVRGEDSLVRAIFAAKPFIWNAYLQKEKYQKVKVEALLNRMEPYFSDKDVFSRYYELQMAYNDAETETPDQVTAEDYRSFFGNLTKISHATREMSYFLARNCDLVKQFSAFLLSL